MIRDHPKSYMWDKKEIHIVLCHPPPETKMNEV